MCGSRAEDGHELLGQQLLNLTLVAVDDERDLRQGGRRLLARSRVLEIDELQERDDRVALEPARALVSWAA